MFPQEVFTYENLKAIGLKDLNIHSAEFGWMMRQFDHIDAGGIHPAGWNDDWKDWMDRAKVSGTSLMELGQQIEAMKAKYELKLKGLQATFSYWTKEKAYQQARTLSAMGSKSKRVSDAVKPVLKRWEKLYAEEVAASKAAAKVAKLSKIALKIPNGPKLGGPLSFFAGIITGCLFGAEDPAGDAIDSVLLTSNGGGYEPWDYNSQYLEAYDEYQLALDFAWANGSEVTIDDRSIPDLR